MATKQLDQAPESILEELSPDMLDELYQTLRKQKDEEGEPLLHLAALVAIIMEDDVLLKRLGQKETQRDDSFQ